MALIYNLYTLLTWLGLSRFAITKGFEGVGGCIADGSSPGRECPFLALLYQGICGFLLLWPWQRIAWVKKINVA